MDTDALVIGAGPTGLALACALRDAGIGVRVLDKATGPAVTSRALGLQPRGVEVLDRIGALGFLPDRGLPVERVRVTVDGHPLADLPLTRSTRLAGPRALLMSQADIEEGLRKRLHDLGGAAEWGHELTHVALGTDDVIAHFAAGAVLRARWLVGADGAHSAVRKATGIAFPGTPLVERFLLADVHAELDLPRNSTHGYLRGARLLAAFPLPGGDVWRLMAPAPPELPVDATSIQIVDYLGRRLADEAHGRITSVKWVSTFRIQRRLADTYRRGRVLLAGDAAHIHSPLGGQGLNTGIGDAENLAWKLALVIRGRADDTLLDTYGAERRPIAETVLETTSGLTQTMVGDTRAARFVRDRIAVPLMNTTWLQRRIAEKSSQLQVTYRRGPLGDSPLHGLLPGSHIGDRIPDRACVRADGSATRLYAELGPAWALLGDAALAPVAAERLGDVVALPCDGESQLIRPDGHLAWHGTSHAALLRCLDAVLDAPRAAAA